MLFKDPYYREWVEPTSFYPSSSEIFYEKNKNIYRDEEEGFTIEAVKEHAWHGIPVIGLKIQTGDESLIFSSDTINDTNLWKELSTEKCAQKLTMSPSEFESASVLYGDINDYIERIWSRERYSEAVSVFDDAIVVHDVCTESTAVHTHYSLLEKSSLNRERAILTHSPDRITSEWPLCDRDKTFKIKGRKFFEVVGDKLYPMNADIYYKEDGRYLVGYRNKKGSYAVYERNGLIELSNGNDPGLGTPLFKVDLYEDISGGYFPVLEKANVTYRKREDGRVEIVEFTDMGSTGKITESWRDRLNK